METLYSFTAQHSWIYKIQNSQDLSRFHFDLTNRNFGCRLLFQTESINT